jgi:hypothetical protein
VAHHTCFLQAAAVHRTCRLGLAVARRSAAAWEVHRSRLLLLLVLQERRPWGQPAVLRLARSLGCRPALGSFLVP